MRYLNPDKVDTLSNEELVEYLKETSNMLLNEYSTNSVELDSCQEYNNGKKIIYNENIVGIMRVDNDGLKYNDCNTGDILGTITFEQALNLDSELLSMIVINYQGTIVNEVL